LPADDKRQIVSAPLNYLNGSGVSSGNISKYDIALKRRHGAKKNIGIR
jgi:hypothetical protein